MSHVRNACTDIGASRGDTYALSYISHRKRRCYLVVFDSVEYGVRGVALRYRRDCNIIGIRGIEAEKG